MSLSSPYGQNGSPLGGTGITSPFGWNNWQQSTGGALSPTPQPQPAPQTSLNGIQSGSAVVPPQPAPQTSLNNVQSGGAIAPPDVASPQQQPAPQTSLNGIQTGSAVVPPGITSGANNMMQTVAQAPPGITAGASPVNNIQPITGAASPTSMMVNALVGPQNMPQGIGSRPV